MNKFDAIVVGAGYHGCACAYFLAKIGLSTLLVDAGEVGCGASGANFGSVQVQDSSLGLSLELTLLGAERMRTMEKELGQSFGYTPRGSLLVAENERQLPELEKVYNGKKEAGLPVRWLTEKEVLEAEPNIAPGSILAASYHKEAFVYPFHYLYALVNAGKEHGLKVMENVPVAALIMEAGECRGIILKDGTEYRSDNVVVAAGAGTMAICRTAGILVPVLTTKAESFVSEAIRPFLRNYYSSAGFFLDSHSQDGVSASLCVSQSIYGNMLFAETTKPYESVDPIYHDCSSGEHCRRIKAELVRVFPCLENINILRSWVASSPFTEDYEPYFGQSPIPGLILASGFKSSVVMSAIVGETVAELVSTGSCRFNLKQYTDRVSRVE